MIGHTLLHYEIVGKLGEGGMGEVYRARDTRLGREVAVKVLSRGTDLDPDRRARFRREATAVAALKHPNIVTIHSVEEDGSTLFLTMELVEGKSLNRLIPPGGMNLLQLLDIAIPVADAVSHAHAKGITHRDLKPANIVLDEAGRPKVLDFGLARLAPAETTAEDPTLFADQAVTREGTILGTTSYMSPEQAEGKPTDARSDIFSLGIILYEMATGQKPFRGDTPISTISSILKDTPPSVTELNRSLPNHMGRVVNRCLAKDPTRRYQVGLDLRNELEGLREESSGVARPSQMSAPSWAGADPASAPPSSGPTPPSGWTAGPGPAGPPQSSPSFPSSVSAPSPSARRPALLGIAAAVALLAVAAAVWQPWRPRNGAADRPAATAAASERPMAVVFPFENLGPAEDAYFAAGVTDEITARLAGVSALGVISRTSATQYDRTGKTMRQIAEDLGVDYVLEGTVRWAKGTDGLGRVRITPQLVRAADDVHVWSSTFDRDMDDIFEVQSEIAVTVVRELGVSLGGDEESRLGERPTDNIEAYQAYLQSQEVSATNPVEFDAKAVSLLDRAVELDPKFIKAWLALSKHHADWYRFLDRTEARLAKARAAMRSAEAVDADHPLTRLARGYYYYYGFNDYDRALVEFRAAAEAIPNDAEAQSSMAWILRRQGKIADCLPILEKAMALDPRNITILHNTASTYGALRRGDRCIELYDRAIALEPEDDDIRADARDAVLAFTGDLADARRRLKSDPGGNPFFHAMSWTTQYLMERDWSKVLETVRAMDTSSPITRLVTLFFGGIARYGLGDEAAARESHEAAAEICRGVLSESPGNPMFRMMLGSIYASLGRKDEAVQEARTAVDLTALDLYEGPQQLESLASVYTQVGRYDEAFDLIDRLLGMNYAKPLTIHRLEIDPQWDRLRDRPRYEEILAKHGKPS